MLFQTVWIPKLLSADPIIYIDWSQLPPIYCNIYLLAMIISFSSLKIQFCLMILNTPPLFTNKYLNVTIKHLCMTLHIIRHPNYLV